MAETMEQYMSKTRAGYGSGVARPKIKDTDNFKLKGQFLKELRDNTFSCSDHEDANDYIEKVLKIVNLFHILNITIYQVKLRAIPMSLTGATSRWLRNKPSGSITTWEDLKTKFLSKYCPPARTAKKMEEINNFQQEPDGNLYQAWEQFKELLMKCPQHYLIEMQEVVLFYNGLDVPTRQILNSRGAIPSKTTADTQVAIQEMAEYSQKWHNGTSRNRSTETFDGLAAIQSQLNNLGIEIKKVNEKVYAAQVGCEQSSHINNSIPRKEKDPGSFTLPCFINNVCFNNALADLGASVSVMPLSTYLNLGLGELAHTKLTVELADRTVKYPKGIAENMLVGETLVLNRSLDPIFEDYIELNDLNEPLELRRNRVDDLMPTIEEGEVIEEFRAGNDARLKFYNSIREDKLEYKGNNVVRALMNIPIFVRNFSILTDFAVLEDMDAYHDEGMGDVIFGEPFLREVIIKTRWFDGMITVYNGNESVTYQMARSHMRFQQHTNEQCNKIPPLLKVSEEDMINGISHSYQKLKGFYKGVLNLGPILLECHQWRNGLHAGTLACMRWNEEKLKKRPRCKEIDEVGEVSIIWNPMLVPSCFVIFDLEPLTLSLDFVLMYEIFKSLSFRLDRLCRLAILCLDQHAHTLHHLESLITISLDRLDILKEDIFEHGHIVVNPTPAGMRHHHLHLYMNPEIKQLAIKRVDSKNLLDRVSNSKC
ncbi:reverse transcriptase domain-containing protein [Tanacetum coccineum]